MMSVNAEISSVSSWADSVPVSTSTELGRDALISRTSCSGETPFFAATKISSSSPSFSSSACAVSTSKTAKVAFPIESTPPYCAMPTISKSRTGPTADTPIISPTR